MSIARLSYTALLQKRICELPLKLETSPLQVCVNQLYRELQRKGLLFFRPQVYLGDDWFSPSGVPAISIPFYLAHPKLTALEKRTMGSVEGDTRKEFMRLLRHEAGHSFDHAYSITKGREWQALFGNPSRKYTPSLYEVEEDSTDFVSNLSDYYAQAHPDEDFAETFAVWLNPEIEWKKEYRRLPGAYAKLQFIEGLVKKYGSTPPVVRGGRKLGEAKNLRSQLSRYYRRKQLEDARLLQGIAS
jgi:hypothetical protein